MLKRLLGGATLLALACPLRAEIVSISADARLRLEEFIDGVLTDFAEVTDNFPGTTDTLPLQVFTKLDTFLKDQDAAAAGGAQFSDPTLIDEPNPAEFAINITLDSLSPSISYNGVAKLQETREVVFSAAELERPLGAPVTLIGRFFVDGVLAVFAEQSGVDLSGADVELLVRVEQPDAEPRTLLEAAVVLRGAPGGSATTEATGPFADQPIFLSNLSGVIENLDVLRVLVIPQIQVDYQYSAIVGEPLELVATVEVKITNPGGGVGVAAVIGSPLDSLDEVIATVRGATAKERFKSVLASERADPSGDDLNFAPAPGLGGLCGLLGFESALAPIGLLALRTGPRRLVSRRA